MPLFRCNVVWIKNIRSLPLAVRLGGAFVQVDLYQYLIHVNYSQSILKHRICCQNWKRNIKLMYLNSLKYQSNWFQSDSRLGETRTPLLPNESSLLASNIREIESTKLLNQSNVAYTWNHWSVKQSTFCAQCLPRDAILYRQKHAYVAE